MEIDESDLVSHSMLRVTLTMKLRDGSTRVRHPRCDSSGYDYWCQFGQGSVHLAPAGERKIAVFEPGPDASTDEQSSFEAFFDLTLKPSERHFELEERDDAACPQP